MERKKRPGLEWCSGVFAPTPKWTHEPSLSAIEAVCCRSLGTASCSVKFLAAGVWNKAYTITLEDGRQYLMRVSLPLDPKNKIRGEVATLRIVRSATTVPVPEVYAFDDSSENEIGYEWILMQLMPGKPLYYHWRKMTFTQKINLVNQIASYQNQLFNCSTRENCLYGIGTLGTGNETIEGLEPDKVEPGPLVSQLFFIGNHYDYDVQRGPFRRSYEWMRASLDIIIKSQEDAISKAADEEDKEDAMEDMRIIRQLEDILPAVFSPTDDQPHSLERTVLWHNDLNLHNILVDTNGEITAIIDWECVSMLPLWVARQQPDFLSGSVQEIKPERDTFTKKTELEEQSASEIDKLDDEGIDELYWISLMEYEKTQLRKVYAARMHLLWPEWYSIQQEYLKADFYDAATCIATGFIKPIINWIDAIKRKEEVRLMEILK
ncbi:phosphotransferase enzyme family-domain-containing protein [Hypoxylon rubiginosum]|uniref:Phosphotransferase enzyme family-domain-containing protein n=1 Tax=Hypoxylon rubiginosum TaxID=110542 RepID=A0ACC0CSP7_9PEZI|nr:phosphotransferase enzyme family-domain-containing protein [Hypoxylon rubiginosum]